MSCPHDGIGLLLAPLSSLCHAHIATAIDLARDEGARYASSNLRHLLGDRGKEHFADAHDFWAGVVVPARERGEASQEDVDRWEGEFLNGRQMRDPRVQAFCSAWSATASDLASRAEFKRSLLEDVVDLEEEVPTVHAVGPGKHPIFARGDERFAVFLHDEIRNVVEDAIMDTLHTVDPETIAEHSVLPIGAEWVVERLQKEHGAESNTALLRLVDNVDQLIDTLLDKQGLPFLLTGRPEEDVEVESTGSTLVFRWSE
jgi:phosphoglycolate phosphatase-like HAD superfamily hydrolase